MHIRCSNSNFIISGTSFCCLRFFHALTHVNSNPHKHCMRPPNRFVLNSKSKKAKPHTVSIEWFCMAMNWLGLIMSSKKFNFYSKFAVSNVLIKFFSKLFLAKVDGNLRPFTQKHSVCQTVWDPLSSIVWQFKYSWEMVFPTNWRLFFLLFFQFPQSISPGAVKTEIFKPELLDLLPNIPFLDPEDVSQAVMYALATRPHVQV